MSNFTKENITAMESKLNINAVDRYSDDFSRIICDRFFATKEKISGEEIVSLTNIKQINLFAIRVLFNNWKKESTKWESPYFDYQSEEVKKSLKKFLNILSSNISVNRENFEPVLKEAVKHTIQILFSPYDFFTKEIDPEGKGSLSLKSLQETNRYIKINSQFYSALVQRFEATDKKVFTSNEARDILEDVFSKFPGDPEDSSTYQEEFSKVLPLKLADIFSEDHTIAESVVPDTEYQTTINEIHSNKISETVGDALKKLNMNNLRESISLNQKFMFVNSLFSGDNAKFEETLVKIEGMNSRQEIINFMDSIIASDKWDPESEEVMEFYDLVISRFN